MEAAPTEIVIFQLCFSVYLMIKSRKRVEVIRNPTLSKKTA